MKRNISQMQELLDLIKVVWMLVPDLRLCQLLSNSALKSGYGSKDLFYLEDNQLIKSLGEYLTREVM